MVEIRPYCAEMSGIVPDRMYREPENYSELESEAEKAIAHCQEVFGIETDFAVNLAETDTSGFDPQEAHYGNSFMGFSAMEGMRGSEENQIFVRATTEVDYWRPALKDMLNHEIGHQDWYQTGFSSTRSQYFNLRFEGHAMNFAGRVNNKKSYSWSTPERTSERPQVDTEQLLMDLKQGRCWKDSEGVDLSKQLFLTGGDRYSWAEGYRIAYQVVRRVTQSREIGLGDLPTLPNEQWREVCKSTVRNMYG